MTGLSSPLQTPTNSRIWQADQMAVPGFVHPPQSGCARQSLASAIVGTDIDCCDRAAYLIDETARIFD
jgi:hypothetical protein